MNDFDRQIGRALDALADCDDSDRVTRILQVARLLEESANAGPDGDSARRTAVVFRLIADTDLVACGRLSRRSATGTQVEQVLGAVLDRMAAEPDLSRRARMLQDIARLLTEVDDMAAESIACMPYGGLVGGRDDMYWPSSLPKLIRNVFRRWRESRAVV